jgi:hypothetical protein
MHYRVLVIANKEASDEAAMTDAVCRRSGCYLDDLYRACPDLTCNQIVLGEARVSRRDQVQQTLKGRGHDRMALPGQPGGQKPERVSVHGPETAGPGSVRHHPVLHVGGLMWMAGITGASVAQGRRAISGTREERTEGWMIRSISLVVGGAWSVLRITAACDSRTPSQATKPYRAFVGSTEAVRAFDTSPRHANHAEGFE